MTFIVYGVFAGLLLAGVWGDQVPSLWLGIGLAIGAGLSMGGSSKE